MLAHTLPGRRPTSAGACRSRAPTAGREPLRTTLRRRSGAQPRRAASPADSSRPRRRPESRSPIVPASHALDAPTLSLGRPRGGSDRVRRRVLTVSLAARPGHRTRRSSARNGSPRSAPTSAPPSAASERRSGVRNGTPAPPPVSGPTDPDTSAEGPKASEPGDQGRPMPPHRPSQRTGRRRESCRWRPRGHARRRPGKGGRGPWVHASLFQARPSRASSWSASSGPQLPAA